MTNNDEVKKLEEIISKADYSDIISLTDNTIDELCGAAAEKINKPQYHLNRKQRRIVNNRLGKTGRKHVDVISETARKLNYINLIQELRRLNKERENENYEDSDQNN